jgi:soluble lytic murein transglycosylase-like protein
MIDDAGLPLTQREAMYFPLLVATSVHYGLPPEWLVAFAKVESSFHAKAINNSVPDKARGSSRGLCQMSLTTARALGFNGMPEDLFDPERNAMLAGKLCSMNKKSFAVTNLRDVAALYNSGKPYDKAPASTRLIYVPLILKAANMYRARAAELAANPAAMAY